MDYLWLSKRLRSGAGRHCPASPMLSEGEADGCRPEQEPTFVQPHPSTFSHPSCPERSSCDHRLEPERRMLEKIQKMLVVRSPTIRELLAEALGMYILMVFGLSSAAQVVLGKGEFGQYVSINLAFGIGVTLGIHAAGGISDILYDYTKGNFTVTGPTATASIFSTYPHPCVSLLGGFFTEFMATVMLLLGILVIHDEKNNAALKGTQAMLTGILVLGIGLGMGMTTGYAINPSRDLPPRIFTAIAGWGMDVFTAGNYWWWIPVVAPTLGSLVGSLVYKLFIDVHNQSVPESGNEKGQPAIETSTL
ncbi:aquaporin-7 isoform X3 [Anas platyrhynchos]|uniref:aquaporin-7 isoform X3 n=1 Tax=Anas platyrhynchos TaxID=8839 RepID=UPI00065E1305|eukprot:XP_012959461.1 aquaporin-7 isoform X3 [Anas platyrhynchos]